MLRTFAVASVFTALAVAETWSGSLVDASCTAEKKSGAECAPTSSTSSFALVLADGKIVKLDAAGNTKAADALKNSADRSKDPDKKAAVRASVTGSMSGDMIQVESLEVK
jgi:hypothetical protein